MKINELQRDFLYSLHYRIKMLKIKNDESVCWKEQHRRCRVKPRNLAGKLRLKMMNLYAVKNKTRDVEGSVGTGWENED